MISNFLELDQTLHGYDNGHRLLAASLQLEPRDERALLSMSDLSGPRAVDNFLEYLTGYMLPGRSHYAIAKTWYASEMDRPGCVWTHTFLIPRESLTLVPKLDFVHKRFFRPRLRSGYRYADKLVLSDEEINEDPDSTELPELADESVLCGIQEMYSSSETTVALHAKNGNQYEDLSLRLLSQLWADARPQFSFCTGSLSKRSLQGKPLVFQCGPDRVVREIRIRTSEPCKPSIWVDTVARDLEHETPLRGFLTENGEGLTSLSDTSYLVQIFLGLTEGDAHSLLSLLSRSDSVASPQLIRTVFRRVESLLPPLQFLTAILNDRILTTLSGVPDLICNAFKRSLSDVRQETVNTLVKAADKLQKENRELIIATVANLADVEMIVMLSDVAPTLYEVVVEHRWDFCYEPELWKSSLPLLDKIDFFDTMRRKESVSNRRLFKAILDSQDADLSTEVVTHLTEKDLASTLEWLIEGNWTIALRPPWLSYLRRYQDELLDWTNSHRPSKDLLLILANVVEFKQGMMLRLEPETILELARLAGSSLKERHELAAFVYVTVTHVRDPRASNFCFKAFALLHAATAESRLSNRAWQILESNLVALPYEQWDACEKLRRSLLYFTFLEDWPLAGLWRTIEGNNNLVHDFIRTAKAYEPGKRFFAAIRDEGVHGTLSLNKQQFKEIKKLLR